MSENTTRARGGSIIGLILVGLGVTFLLGQIFEIDMWRVVWPFFVIIPGLMFYVFMTMAGQPGGPLAIPATIVTTVGLILLFDSLTGTWYNWAYVWALIFPTSIGVGMMIGGRWSGSQALARNGRRVATIGLIIFLLFAVFFELVINIGENPVAPYALPALMILFGAWLLLRRRSTPGEAPAPRMVESAPTRPSMPTPPRPTPKPAAPTAPAASQFEPLDASRGRKKAKTPAAKGEPEM